MIEAQNQHLEGTDKRAVIFDFDGTIADSFEVFAETIAEMLHREPFTPWEIEHLRGSSISQIEKYAHIQAWQKPGMLLRGRREIARKMDRVPIFEDMDAALRAMSEQERMVYILSSNSTSSIHKFLDRYNVSSYVSAIHGGASVTGKAGHLRRLLRQEGLTPADAIYVGDEVRDIEATQKVGMQCISVAWGYSTLGSLEEHQPLAIASAPSELTYLL